MKLEFPNPSGETLAAALVTPDQGLPKAFALFAHCFTCGKDVAAASRIAMALAEQGIAVLRFDFTGLGNSDGDFSNTNFSTNIDDLLAAADYLGQQFQAPKLLIGHSLGGAAVLAAAHKLPTVEAVVTIAAPATAGHVSHLFASDAEQIRSEGESKVNLGGREFTIKSQFVNDLEQYLDTEHIGKLKKALLVFHSPIDSVVSVDEAGKIFQAAKHPKSFVSLDDADHLLSRKEDSQYVADTLAAWAGRYLQLGSGEKKIQHSLGDGEVFVTEENNKFLRGLYTQYHKILADEPQSVGGSDIGPDPYELLLMSLGACTSMTLRMYANRKKWDIENIQVKLKHQRVHSDDCDKPGGKDCYASVMERSISYEGELTPQEHNRFLEIADKCPVHKTLEGKINIDTKT